MGRLFSIRYAMSTTVLLPPEEIPLLTDTPSFFRRVRLSGVEYVVEFDYHERQDRWYFTLRDSAGVVLIAGQRVRSNRVANEQHVNRTGYPAGLLLFIDTTPDARLNVGYADLGTRVKLYYSDVRIEYPTETEQVVGP